MLVAALSTLASVDGEGAGDEDGSAGSGSGCETRRLAEPAELGSGASACTCVVKVLAPVLDALDPSI